MGMEGQLPHRTLWDRLTMEDTLHECNCAQSSRWTDIQSFTASHSPQDQKVANASIITHLQTTVILFFIWPKCIDRFVLCYNKWLGLPLDTIISMQTAPTVLPPQQAGALLHAANALGMAGGGACQTSWSWSNNTNWTKNRAMPDGRPQPAGLASSPPHRPVDGVCRLGCWGVMGVVRPTMSKSRGGELFRTELLIEIFTSSNKRMSS